MKRIAFLSLLATTSKSGVAFTTLNVGVGRQPMNLHSSMEDLAKEWAARNADSDSTAPSPVPPPAPVASPASLPKVEAPEPVVAMASRGAAAAAVPPPSKAPVDVLALEVQKEVASLRKELDSIKNGSGVSSSNPLSSLSDSELRAVIGQFESSTSTSSSDTLAVGLAAGAVGAAIADPSRRESFGSIVAGLTAPRVMEAAQSLSRTSDSEFPVSTYSGEK